MFDFCFSSVEKRCKMLFEQCEMLIQEFDVNLSKKLLRLPKKVKAMPITEFRQSDKLVLPSSNDEIFQTQKKAPLGTKLVFILIGLFKP
jgi:hypothetical protein